MFSIVHEGYTSHQNDSTEKSAAPCIPHEASLIVRRFMFEIFIFHGKYKALPEYIWQNASKAEPIFSIEWSKRPLHAIKTFEGSEERAKLMPGPRGMAYCIWADGQQYQTDVSNLDLVSRDAAKVLPAKGKKGAAAKKKKEAAAKKNKAKPKKGAKAAKKETAKAAKAEESESELDSESDTDPDDAKPEEEVPTVAKPPAKATAAVGAAKAKNTYHVLAPKKSKES